MNDNNIFLNNDLLDSLKTRLIKIYTDFINNPFLFTINHDKILGDISI